VRGLGEVYLEDGASLVHGDFFRKLASNGARESASSIPSSASWGAAFDLGVLRAHLHLSRQPEPPRRHDTHGAARLRGSGEWLRRGRDHAPPSGVAQLPLDAGLEEKRELLALSKALM
jgi:hypothetical protein